VRGLRQPQTQKRAEAIALALLMAYQLIRIFADLASGFFSTATSSTRAATSTVIATIRARWSRRTARA
jgi:hypothetical protein